MVMISLYPTYLCLINDTVVLYQYFWSDDCVSLLMYVCNQCVPYHHFCIQYCVDNLTESGGGDTGKENNAVS